MMRLISAALLTFVLTAQCSAENLWLSIGHREDVNSATSKGAADFYDFFDPKKNSDPDTPRVNGFKFYSKFFLTASDQQIAAVLNYMKNHSMAVGVEAGALSPKDGCGINVEGYNPNYGTLDVISRKIKRLGGELDYIMLDEPFWFGHLFSGKNSCKSDISEVTDQLARQVGIVRQIFPRVRIVDVEPVGDKVSDDFEPWLTELKAKLDGTLYGVHADVLWDRGGPNMLPTFTKIVQKHGLQMGVIYNGSDYTKSDEEWVASSTRHISMIASLLDLSAVDAIFQTWRKFPKRILPSTSPDTLLASLQAYVVERGNRTNFRGSK